MQKIMSVVTTTKTATTLDLLVDVDDEGFTSSFIQEYNSVHILHLKADIYQSILDVVCVSSSAVVDMAKFETLMARLVCHYADEKDSAIHNSLKVFKSTVDCSASVGPASCRSMMRAIIDRLRRTADTRESDLRELHRHRFPLLDLGQFEEMWRRLVVRHKTRKCVQHSSQSYVKTVQLLGRQIDAETAGAGATAAMPKEVRPCGECGMRTALTCAGCGRTHYCSKPCQLQARQRHRPTCQPSAQMLQRMIAADPALADILSACNNSAVLECAASICNVALSICGVDDRNKFGNVLRALVVAVPSSTPQCHRDNKIFQDQRIVQAFHHLRMRVRTERRLYGYPYHRVVARETSRMMSSARSTYRSCFAALQTLCLERKKLPFEALRRYMQFSVAATSAAATTTEEEPVNNERITTIPATIARVAAEVDVARQRLVCRSVECGKRAPTKACARCQRACYCSADCQRADWKLRHRRECLIAKID